MKKKLGIAAMKDKARALEIARMGGLAAHAKGTAHEWTKEEATIAGRMGGRKTQENIRLQNNEKTG